jgi:hypothetical protein
VNIGLIPATGFDVHVTTTPDAPLRRSDKSFVGSLSLFRHAQSPSFAAGHDHELAMQSQHGGHAGGHDSGDTFVASDAISAIGAQDLSKITVVLVPYPLLTVPGKETVIVGRSELQADGIRFLLAR